MCIVDLNVIMLKCCGQTNDNWLLKLSAEKTGCETYWYFGAAAAAAAVKTAVYQLNGGWGGTAIHLQFKLIDLVMVLP